MAQNAANKLWQEGASAWPQLELPEPVFASFLGDHHRRQSARLDSFGAESSDAAELYLICACLEQLRGAHQAFQTRYLAPARAATKGMKLSDAILSDVEQLAYEKLFVASAKDAPKILDYVGQGNLAVLVRVVVVRTALSQLRKQKREVLSPDDDFGALPDELNDPALELIRLDFKREFGPAFAESLATLSERDRNFLRLRFVDGLQIEHISQLYQMHRVTASRALSRIRKTLRDETRSRLGAKLHLTPETLDSFMRLVDSRLDMSIEWDLKAAGSAISKDHRG